MGASRTLRRKLLADQARRAKTENKKVKPGTAFSRVVTLQAALLGIEHTYHATKGHRFIRVAL